VTGVDDPERLTLRLATVADADAVAALHASRISEGFLVTLGPAFLRRLYRRIVQSPGAFVMVVDAPATAPAPAGSRAICGFIAVAESTGALYREYLVRDGVPAAFAAARGIARAPRAVFETLRYGLRGGGHESGAEVLATAVAIECGQRGVGTRLVRCALDELRARGVSSARVVTAVGNHAATRAYERGGFRKGGLDEVHRGVAQQLLVWP
jgi:ribosomal protein S18 acetylase RimI-like enzyme